MPLKNPGFSYREVLGSPETKNSGLLRDRIEKKRHIAAISTVVILCYYGLRRADMCLLICATNFKECVAVLIELYKSNVSVSCVGSHTVRMW